MMKRLHAHKLQEDSTIRQPQFRQRWWHPLVRKLAAKRPVVWITSRTLHHIDRFVIRVSHGKHSAATFLSGLPIVTLTAQGARSGQSRSVPLIAIPDRANLLFIASNWGQEGHPGWYHNVRANPQVTVAYDGQIVVYFAQEVTGSAREPYWRKAVAAYPGYAAYEQHACGRTIPVIICTPQDNSPVVSKEPD